MAHETPAIEEATRAKTEKIDRHDLMDNRENPPSKRIKPSPSGNIEPEGPASSTQPEEGLTRRERQKGVAPIKVESVCSQSPRCWCTYPREGFSCAN